MEKKSVVSGELNGARSSMARVRAAECNACRGDLRGFQF